MHGLPDRAQVPAEHRWNLSRLFPSDEAWEEGFRKLSALKADIPRFKGTLGRSPEKLRECLDFSMELERLEERLGYYAMLRSSEDVGDSSAQARQQRHVQAGAEISALWSYRTPEIMAIPDEVMGQYLSSEVLAPYRVWLGKLLRYKPHTLTEAEERLLAMQEEFAGTASQAYEALTDVDLDFGTIETPEGPRPLTQSSYGAFMVSPDRDLRRRAWTQFMEGFERNRHTLATLYAGSVNLDVYRARVRGFPSALSGSLFADDVPVAVYDNLVSTVRESLPALHDYYDLRRRVLGVSVLGPWDTRVPLVPEVERRHTYEEAVEIVMRAVEPLGGAYGDTLRAGLLGGWVDRYENKGKRSGAFSAGSFSGDPYILLNYKEELLDDVFTLAHEAGHSMHSWYSAKHQPFPHYHYTIFVAEVASTVNEQLLSERMMAEADSPALEAYLVGRQVDAIIGTIFRQTMFAAFEKAAHDRVESRQPLTVDDIRSIYRDLLTEWFGPAVALEPLSDLESLRIPHFFWAFYVYKYATGLSAAIALSRRILDGTPGATDAYLGFLRSGGSKFPLEQLRDAGVDMSSPAPIRSVMTQFEGLVKRLRELLLPG